MKKVKSMIITLMMCSITMFSFGQSLKNDVFYTTFETGVGEKINMEFNVDLIAINKIQETEIFKPY